MSAGHVLIVDDDPDLRELRARLKNVMRRVQSNAVAQDVPAPKLDPAKEPAGTAARPAVDGNASIPFSGRYVSRSYRR